ncbi:unnamed protein product [Miscanthus lutarioriparius]|uniref:Uncharacterized protein n=1 Tax=Miscanthus lutarioriparius TaxID=422564 RepID=A0A811RYT1_9POAL|nr:unnamed protein product [Miscanthus lutarioriparius]
MRHAGVACAIKEQDREGEDDEVRVTMDDDDVDYPKTINEDLIAFGLTPDDVEDVGGAAAALFGSSVALINLEVAPASDVAGSNDHDSLTSTTENPAALQQHYFCPAREDHANRVFSDLAAA